MTLLNLNFLVCLLITFYPDVYAFMDYDFTQSESVTLTIRDYGTAGTHRGHYAALEDWLQITVQRQGNNNVSLVLERNRNIHTDVPVSVYRNGKILYQEINDTEAVGFYCSLEPYATVMATANTRSGSSPLRLTGDLRLEEVTYRLIYHEGTGEYRLGILEDSMYRNDDFIIRPESNKTDLTETEFTRFINTDENINKPLYEIEILAVADFSEYLFWLRLVTKDDSTMPFVQRDLAAKEKLRQYIAFVLNGVDLRYRSIATRNYNIRVLFSGLHIADKKQYSTWTEDNKRKFTNPVQVDSDSVLEDFTDWCSENEEHLVGHDHAILFTKYDMARTENGVVRTNIVGISYVGDICLRQKQSLIEDDFGEDVSLTAAHELGHNMGAEHDGIHDLCQERDGYIMSPIIAHNQPLLRNHWKFSDCSQYYFYKTIKELNGLRARNTSSGDESYCINCMATRENNVNLLPDYFNKLPGQIYGPDEQCEYRYGKGSYLFRNEYKTTYTDICDTLKCSDPANMGYHYVTDTMEGTACGMGKLCRSGYCVEDLMANQYIKDTCPFGDSPEVSHGSNMKCSALLDEPYWNAYRCQTYLYSCCETCSNLHVKPTMSTSTTTTERPTMSTSTTTTERTRITETPEHRQPSVGECITSCVGVKDGQYQSCKGCHVYASCFMNALFDRRPCQLNLVWSDDLKRCDYNSITCEP